MHDVHVASFIPHISWILTHLPSLYANKDGKCIYRLYMRKGSLRKIVSYLSLREENSWLAFEAMLHLTSTGGGSDLSTRCCHTVLAGDASSGSDGRTTTHDAVATLSCLHCSVFDCHFTADVTA